MMMITALRVLRAHGLCDSALHTIYRSVVVAKLLYATRVKEMDTVHPIYLILTICAPQ